MTRSTDTNRQNKIIECLENIYNNYSSFSLNPAENIEESIDCFLSIFKREFNGNWTDSCPIKAVLPLFYQLEDWNNWKTKEITYYKYLSSIGNLDERITAQSSLSKEYKISFSQSILKLQNEIGLNEKLPTYIRIEIGNRDNISPDSSRLSFLNYINTNTFSNFSHSIELKNYELNVIKRDYSSLPSFSPTSFVQLNDTLNEFLNAAKMHTLYLEIDSSLIYVFSDNVGEYEVPDWLNIKKRGIGGMFLIVQKSLLEKKDFEDKFIKIIKQLTDKIANRIIQFYQINIIQKHAIRAAISQVMSRNMSHNIGSHVLSKMLTQDVVENCFSSTSQYKSEFDYIYNQHKPTKITRKNFNLINFNSYLRTRMDFLADIATAEPTMETTCLIIKDVIGDIDKNRILLNNISGVESFPYSINVKDCRNCPEDCTKNICFCNKSNNNDIPISIPNGNMGYHALFIIIENIIRNTAKHSGQNNSIQNHEKIDFTLEVRISSTDNTLYEILAYDSVPRNKEDLERLIEKLNKRITDPVIKAETSKLRDGAWGMIEMKAAAAYLRKLAPEKIDEYNPSNIQILEAINKNNFLGYRFHVMKPKELLIVDEQGCFYDSLMNISNGEKLKFDLLKEHGIWVKQTNIEKEDYFDIEKIYAHPFMLVFAGKDFDINKYLYVNGEKTNLFKGNLPNRIIICQQGSEKPQQNDSPWVAYIDDKNELITALNDPTLEKLERKHFSPTTSNEELINAICKNTIMDLVWKIWLENKIIVHQQGIGNFSLNDILNFVKSDYNNILSHFAHHGEGEVAYRFKSEDEHKETKFRIEGVQTADNSYRPEYFLTYPSSAKNFMDDATKKNINVNKLYSAILSENILNKILIIDERVQSSWDNMYSSTSVKKNKLYRDCGMYCPDKDCEHLDLNAPSFDSNYETNILNFIGSLNNSNKLSGLDFIVIHLGVIEKILTINGGQKDKESVRTFILKIQNKLEEFKTRIIITSGRGKPDNLPEEVPFVSFSTLSQYALETPFKPFLNQVIQSARIFKTT